MTTSLVALGRRPNAMTRTADVDGVTVHYLGTPARYRWMGVTPTIHRRLSALERPDVLHVFGFRDFVGTFAAGWARRQGVPYLFEGLGMVRPMLRKVALKRAVDVHDLPARTRRCSAARRRLLARARRLPRRGPRPGSHRPQADRVPGSRPLPSPGPAPSESGSGSTPPYRSCSRWAGSRPERGSTCSFGRFPTLEGTHLAIVGPDDRGTTVRAGRGWRRSSR